MSIRPSTLRSMQAKNCSPCCQSAPGLLQHLSTDLLVTRYGFTKRTQVSGSLVVPFSRLSGVVLCGRASADSRRS